MDGVRGKTVNHRLLFKTVLFAAALFLAPGQARAQCFFNVVNDFICPGMATAEPVNPFLPAPLIPPPPIVPAVVIWDPAAAYAIIRAAQQAAGVAGIPIVPGPPVVLTGLPGGSPGGIGLSGGLPGGLPGP